MKMILKKKHTLVVDMMTLHSNEAVAPDSEKLVCTSLPGDAVVWHVTWWAGSDYVWLYRCFVLFVVSAHDQTKNPTIIIVCM